MDSSNELSDIPLRQTRHRKDGTYLLQRDDLYCVSRCQARSGGCRLRGRFGGYGQGSALSAGRTCWVRPLTVHWAAGRHWGYRLRLKRQTEKISSVRSAENDGEVDSLCFVNVKGCKIVVSRLRNWTYVLFEFEN